MCPVGALGGRGAAEGLRPKGAEVETGAGVEVPGPEAEVKVLAKTRTGTEGPLCRTTGLVTLKHFSL